MKFHLIIFLSIFIILIPHKIYAQEKFKSEIIEYKRILESEPESYVALFGLARALAFSGNHQEAIEAYTNLLSKYDNDADGLLGRGRVYAWMGKFNKSENDIQKVVKYHPSYADAWSALGDMYKWSNQRNNSIEAYKRWMELEPDKSEPYVARASVLIENRQFSEARFDLTLARDNDGDKYQIDMLIRILNRIPSATLWEFTVSQELQTFTPKRENWNTTTFGVNRELANGSIAIGGLKTERFSIGDESLFIDIYYELWRNSYANLRLDAGIDPTVIANQITRIEVFQSVGDGWEFSANYRRMEFINSKVDIYGLSLAKYVGRWYLRENTSIIPKDGKLGYTNSVSIRRYLSTIDNFLEIRMGHGQEEVILRASSKPDKLTRDFISIRLQHFLSNNYGLSIGSSYNDEQGAPIRRVFQFSLIIRN